MCYTFLISPLVPVSCSRFHRVLAEDWCSNDRGTELLLHMTDYTQTSTTASNHHALEEESTTTKIIRWLKGACQAQKWMLMIQVSDS